MKVAIIPLLGALFVLASIVSESNVEAQRSFKRGCPAGVKVGWTWQPVSQCRECRCAKGQGPGKQFPKPFTVCNGCWAVLPGPKDVVRPLDVTKAWPDCCPKLMRRKTPSQ